MATIPFSLGGPGSPGASANSYTVTNGFIKSLKRRGMLPSTAGTLTDDDFIAIADEELQTYIAELLLEANEEYLVTTFDYTVVAGQDTYEFPPRCVADTLRAVFMVDNAGGFYKLPRIEPERQEDYPATGGVYGYKLEGNNVVLIPSPSSSVITLRLKYELRPNRLVADSSTGVIASINAGAKQVVLASATPSTFGSSTPFDLIRATPHFDTLAMDQSATVSSTTLTFANALPTGLAVGDYVALAGQSCIPQVPHHLHPLLVQRVKAVVLDALRDKSAANAFQLCEQMRGRALKMMVKRVPGSARIIKNRYGPGMNRARGWRA